MKINTVLLNHKGNVSDIVTNNINITKFTLHQLKGIIQKKGQGKISLLYTFENSVSFFGWNKGKAGTENKHELPPPIDSQLYFGDILVYQHEKDNTLINFTKKDWNIWYEKQFGGFEDIGSEDTESNPDSVEIDEDYLPGDELDTEEIDFNSDELSESESEYISSERDSDEGSIDLDELLESDYEIDESDSENIELEIKKNIEKIKDNKNKNSKKYKSKDSKSKSDKKNIEKIKDNKNKNSKKYKSKDSKSKSDKKKSKDSKSKDSKSKDSKSKKKLNKDDDSELDYEAVE